MTKPRKVARKPKPRRSARSARAEPKPPPRPEGCCSGCGEVGPVAADMLPSHAWEFDPPHGPPHPKVVGFGDPICEDCFGSWIRRVHLMNLVVAAASARLNNVVVAKLAAKLEEDDAFLQRWASKLGVRRNNGETAPE